MKFNVEIMLIANALMLFGSYGLQQPILYITLHLTLHHNILYSICIDRKFGKCSVISNGLF